MSTHVSAHISTSLLVLKRVVLGHRNSSSVFSKCTHRNLEVNANCTLANPNRFREGFVCNKTSVIKTFRAKMVFLLFLIKRQLSPSAILKATSTFCCSQFGGKSTWELVNRAGPSLSRNLELQVSGRMSEHDHFSKSICFCCICLFHGCCRKTEESLSIPFRFPNLFAV